MTHRDCNGLWAIRHIPTKQLMPLMPTGRGYTSWDPTDPVSQKRLPRFFRTKQAAKLALVAWLCGEWKPDYEENDSPFGPATIKIGASPPKVKDPTRKNADMILVLFRVEEVEGIGFPISV